jgi:dienelactone hydrolase
VPGARPPYDVVQFRVDYPAAAAATADAGLGLIGPDPSYGRLPVVILHGNFNCPPHLYLWLARRLALAGRAAVTFTWVTTWLDDRPGLSTGIDLGAVAPDATLRRSPHLVLEPLLGALTTLPEIGASLDTDRVVLGGHSAGGTLALLAAAPAWHPRVRGAFSYGGHTRAQVPQGLGTDTYLPLSGDLPLLLVAGTADGVVGAIAARQGHTGSEHPMVATRHRAVPDAGDAWLVMIEGADHYAVADGYDGSTGRGYLEQPGPADPSVVRDRFAALALDLCSVAFDGSREARRRLDAVASPG